MKRLLVLCALMAACTRDAPQQNAVTPAAVVSAPTSVTSAITDADSSSWFERFVGVGYDARDGADCLAIANDGLAAGTQVLLVSPGAPQRVDSARIAERREAACTEPHDEFGHALIDRAAYYNLALDKPAEFGGPTIALLAPRIQLLNVRDSIIIGDVDGDGQDEQFESCASNEGLHLSIVTGQVVRWHAYYYVPYDLQRNCAERPLLGELAKGEGKDLLAPFELFVATFAADEGSYGSGPRILLIENDLNKAVANIRGTRTTLTRTASKGPYCEEGGTSEQRYESSEAVIETKFTTSQGEEACWVEGSVTVTVKGETRVYRVKGASGI